MQEEYPPGLLERLDALENAAEQGEGFGFLDWIWLLLLGAIGPALLLWWGWQ